MIDSKPWYWSVGVWGAITTLIASIAGLFKSQLDPQLLSDIQTWLISVVTLAGGAIALWGRLRATRRIGPEDPSIARQNWRSNAWLLAVVSLAFLQGCAALQSPAGPYVAADRATFQAIAPEYEAYLLADPRLTTEQRARRQRTVQTWQLRIDSAEKSVTDALPVSASTRPEK